MSDPDDRPQFSVCQFFPDGSHEYIKRFVSAQEAVDTAKSYTAPNRPSVKMGITKRVIITDGGDYINWEWIHGKGLVYPPKDH